MQLENLGCLSGLRSFYLGVSTNETDHCLSTAVNKADGLPPSRALERGRQLSGTSDAQSAPRKTQPGLSLAPPTILILFIVVQALHVALGI